MFRKNHIYKNKKETITKVLVLTNYFPKNYF